MSESKADKAAADKAAADKAAAEKRDGFTVAKGKAIATKDGVKAGGDEIPETMYSAEQIARMKAKGLLEK